MVKEIMETASPGANNAARQASKPKNSKPKVSQRHLDETVPRHFPVTVYTQVGGRKMELEKNRLKQEERQHDAERERELERKRERKRLQQARQEQQVDEERRTQRHSQLGLSNSIMEFQSYH
ncbi:putative uncharacterized protein DDB_G0271982 [Sardina pilchardus]|uniref:putative uncharacterized protein DDB_G0271982 n=1 Tax=Sardina pilchardus TaxID=27697 RepID=UPI002E10C2B0